ncbi:MAG TPA: GTPase ObgE [Chitinivibrionales bacterium]|nr:GTPase ObgE [Chitinivibrionales bacterium]
MFIDESLITVKGGSGGNGCFAYLREKYRPRGGPSGGSGGKGGSVFLQGSHDLHTLADLEFRRHYAAGGGASGRGGNKDGRDGQDIIIHVPLGTVVSDADSGEQLFDAVDGSETFCAARGGAGGRGNAELRTRKNPLPDHAEPGEPGEEKRLRLELKLLADVGLVGRPNAGKSTFLSCISAAKPKIADYPFTTTRPFLGIVAVEGFQSFVVADIPGLIQNSHLGKGLGIKFLRHIERTRVLALLIPADSEDPLAEAALLTHELEAYSPLLARKPKCFIMSKSDLCAERLRPPRGWLAMSSITGRGVKPVLKKLKAMLEAAGGAGAAEGA